MAGGFGWLPGLGGLSGFAQDSSEDSRAIEVSIGSPRSGGKTGEANALRTAMQIGSVHGNA